MTSGIAGSSSSSPPKTWRARANTSTPSTSSTRPSPSTITSQQFPDFQPEIVRDRRHLIAEKRDELKVAMRAPKAPAVAEAPAPAALPNSANPAQPLQISPPPLPGTEFAEPPVAVPVATNRTMEIESEGEFALPSWDEGASQALPRAGAAPAPGMPRVETRGGSAVGAIASSLHDDLSRKTPSSAGSTTRTRSCETR